MSRDRSAWSGRSARKTGLERDVTRLNNILPTRRCWEDNIWIVDCFGSARGGKGFEAANARASMPEKSKSTTAPSGSCSDEANDFTYPADENFK